MKRFREKEITILLCCMIAALCVSSVMVLSPKAEAAYPIAGAYTATASGSVTKGLFVKFTAAGTIATATANTDAIVGICEQTTTTGLLTKYAPAFSRATVTSVEAITVGELLTANSAGKAVGLGGGNCRAAAYALTAAASADLDVQVIVLAAPSYSTAPTMGSTTVAADVLVIPVTHAVVYKTTGADAEALTLANGVPGQLLTIHLKTDGGGDGTLTPATSTDFGTAVFADAGDRITVLYVSDTVGWVVIGAAGLAAPPAVTAAS